MTKLGVLLARLRENEKGATMIEYSILIGIITVVAIGFIGLMGGYVQEQWSELVTATSAG